MQLTFTEHHLYSLCDYDIYYVSAIVQSTGNKKQTKQKACLPVYCLITCSFFHATVAYSLFHFILYWKWKCSEFSLALWIKSHPHTCLFQNFPAVCLSPALQHFAPRPPSSPLYLLLASDSANCHPQYLSTKRGKGLPWALLCPLAWCSSLSLLPTSGGCDASFSSAQLSISTCLL